MSMHVYHAGKSKEYIRDSVFLYFMDCSNVLTLPNLYFDLELKLIKDGKKVTSVERDYKIYMKQKLIAPTKLNINHTDIKNFDVTKYDGIFLDLCGTFSESADAALSSIKSGTKIAVTFMMARENKQLQQVIDIKNREESYIKLLSNYGIFVTKYVNYRDSKSPMCVFFGEKQ